MPRSDSEDSLCECKLSKGSKLYTKYCEVFENDSSKEWDKLDKADKKKWVAVAQTKSAPKKKKVCLDSAKSKKQ